MLIAVLREGLEEFDITERVMKNITYVTDDESTVKASLKRFLRRLGSVTYPISSFLLNAFKKLVPLRALIAACKDLTDVFTASPAFNGQLKNALDPISRNSFTSIYAMMETIHTQFSSMSSIVRRDKIHSDIMQSIDKRLLLDVISFLKPFHESFRQLEGHQSTVQYVIPIISRLRKHCQTSRANDHLNENEPTDIVDLLKLRGSKALENYVPHLLHKVRFSMVSLIYRKFAHSA